MPSFKTHPEGRIAAEQRWSSVLEMAVVISKASGGAIWGVEQANVKLLAQHQLGAVPLNDIHHQWEGHTESLQWVIKERKSRTLDANFEQGNGTLAIKILMVPIAQNEDIVGVLELFLPASHEHSPAEIEKQIRTLLDWSAPQAMQPTGESAIRFANWLVQVHRSLPLQACANAIVNETRLWSGWDRVSLFVWDGQRFQLAAVSGVETIDRRSTTVSLLEQIVNHCPESSEILISRKGAEAAWISEYHERTNATTVALCPIVDATASQASKPIGMLLLDQFGDGLSDDRKAVPLAAEELKSLLPHISGALKNSLAYEQASGSAAVKLQRYLRSRRFGRTIALLVTLLVGMLFLSCYPVQLTVGGIGFLKPVHQQDLFALNNGFVEKTFVSPGEVVQQGEALIQLRSPDLEFERNRLVGELGTVTQQIGDLEKLRTDPRRATEFRQSAGELAVRSEELKTVQESLRQQIELLDQQQAELTLNSPLSGTVTTWELKELLAENRPVTRTDKLLTVADLEGMWRAEFHIDHRDIGPVLQAFEQQSASAEFVTADAPEVVRHTKVAEVSPEVQTNPISGTILRASAFVARDQIPDAKPGTSLRFRIECGRVSIGYFLFRRFWDRLYAWWILL